MLADLFSQVPWLHVYVGFSLSVHAFEQYLNFRQLRRLSSTKSPALLGAKVSDEEFKTANAYNADNTRFTILSSAVETAVSTAETAYFFGPWLWRTSGRLVGTANEYAQSSAFLGLSFFVNEIISTPFQIYKNFVIEERHGFNKMTFFLFVKDKLISWFLTIAIGTPIALAAIPLTKWGGDRFYLWVRLRDSRVLKALRRCVSRGQKLCVVSVVSAICVSSSVVGVFHADDLWRLGFVSEFNRSSLQQV